MKVLHVIDSGGVYGAEIVLLNLASEQCKLKILPVIASIGDHKVKEKPLEVEAIKRGLVVEKFRMKNGPNIIGAFKIMLFAQRNNIDIIHNHGYKGDILLGFIPKILRRIPIISTLHGWTNTESFSKMRLYENLHALSLHFVDAVVVVNKAMLSHKRLKKVKDKKLYHVQNGISKDDNSPKKLDNSIIDFSSRGFTIVSCGRLSKEKGYKYLIHALNKIIKDGVNAFLVIFGEGPERESLQKLISALKLEDRVLLPGYMKSSRHYFRYCDIFVLSSLTEGLPITLLEAMQEGVPIIATRVGGIPDMLTENETGILVQPEDIEGLGCAILSLYKDKKKREEIAIKAQKLVSNEFSSEKMALGYKKIYQGCIKVHRNKIID